MLGIFLDTETNGLNPKLHTILELAFKIVDLSSGILKDEYQTIISHPKETWDQSDKESLLINGFKWDDLQQGKKLELAAQEIIDCFSKWGVQRKKAVFICQNPSFDRNFFTQLIDTHRQEQLNWPYHWLDLASMHWALCLKKAQKEGGHLPWETGLSKDSIATYYHLPEEAKPHRAMNGVSHLLLCYTAVVGFPRKI